MKRRYLEDAEQMALIKWASLTNIGGHKVSDYLFHPANGGKRNIREAARLKRMGVKAGVSDLFLPIPTSGKAGLWIELKAGKGLPSESQIQWLTRMGDVGYATAICHGWEAAKRAITTYLEGK